MFLNKFLWAISPSVLDQFKLHIDNLVDWYYWITTVEVRHLLHFYYSFIEFGMKTTVKDTKLIFWSKIWRFENAAEYLFSKKDNNRPKYSIQSFLGALNKLGNTPIITPTIFLTPIQITWFIFLNSRQLFTYLHWT